MKHNVDQDLISYIKRQPL